MTGEERRRYIVSLLEQASGPLTGAELARDCQVSRQVVVQDIALLRADGCAISSTTHGYALERHKRPCRLFKVHHYASEVGDELRLIVDLGGTVEDTMVNHRTYGVVSAPLGVASRRDVERFLDDLATSRSSLLSGTTSGYHFHHVSAQSEEVLDLIEQALADHGWLAEMDDYERQTMR